jgi:hypothetical protein
MSDRERKIAYVWFCLGYAHGYDAGHFKDEYEPRKKWDMLTEKKMDGWIKEIRDVQGGDDGE